MPGKLTLTLRGVESTKEALNGVKTGVANRVVKAALRKVASHVSKKAKSLAPVRSGQTRKSVGVVYRTYKKKLAPSFAFVIGPRKGFRVAAGPDGRAHDPAKIGHIIEGGRQASRPKKKGVLANRFTGQIFGKLAKPVAAKPFMGPAHKSLKSIAPSVLRSEIPAGVAREAAKYKARGKSIYLR